MTEPRQPERTRLVRPDLYRDEVTGPLTPAERDAYIGISTLADDEGYLLWRPAAIAATIYPYVSQARRIRDLGQRSATLIGVGLLVILDCGTCGFLPRAKRDLVISGGKQSRQVLAYHQAHSTDRSVALPDNPAYLSSSSSSSSSDSQSGLSTQSLIVDVDVAREAERAANGHTRPSAAARPSLKRTTETMVTNEDLPAHLRVVQVPR